MASSDFTMINPILDSGSHSNDSSRGRHVRKDKEWSFYHEDSGEYVSEIDEDFLEDADADDLEATGEMRAVADEDLEATGELHIVGGEDALETTGKIPAVVEDDEAADDEVAVELVEEDLDESVEDGADKPVEEDAALEEVVEEELDETVEEPEESEDPNDTKEIPKVKTLFSTNAVHVNKREPVEPIKPAAIPMPSVPTVSEPEEAEDLESETTDDVKTESETVEVSDSGIADGEDAPDEKTETKASDSKRVSSLPEIQESSSSAQQREEELANATKPFPRIDVPLEKHPSSVKPAPAKVQSSAELETDEPGQKVAIEDATKKEIKEYLSSNVFRCANLRDPEALSEYAYKPTDKGIILSAKKPFGNANYKRMQALLRRRVKPSRYLHSVMVSETAEKLARAYGQDPDVARMAGLLHDWDKALSPKRLRDRVANYLLDIDGPTQINMPHILHGPTAAAVLQDEFPEFGAEVYQAIARHTIGGINMTPLDMIVFCADKLEPSHDVQVYRELYDKIGSIELKDLFLAVLKEGMSYLLRANKPLNVDSVDVWNYYVSDEASEEE